MIPGAYLFTMAAGLLQIAGGQGTTLELIGVTLANGTNATPHYLWRSASAS